jgi:hypothetical protein
MTVASKNSTSDASSREVGDKLSRRDWILLPLISLVTIVLLAVSTEVVARRIYYRAPSTNGKCMTFKDPSTGIGALPNSVCRFQSEGQLMEYRFNSSGFRAGMERDPKVHGTYRIVMTGTSTAMGMGVPREKSFAALLPAELTRLTGRKVELYNEALTPNHPEVVARWFNEVLDAKPDLILWIVTPYDVQIGGAPRDPQPDPKAGALTKALYAVKHRPPGQPMADAVRDVWVTYSRTAVLLRHMLDTSDDQYLKSYLIGDDVAGYMNDQPSALWQLRLKRFDEYTASICAQARAAGVPLVVAQLPSRAQVIMVSAGIQSNEYDPYTLDHEVSAIVANHGGTYIDLLSAYRDSYNVDQIYQPADEHPSESGHAFVSRELAAQLTGGAVAALYVAAPSKPQVAQVRAR